MQTTPLAEIHPRLGARMVEFGGWWMPLQYGAGILAEHRHTRECASLFDTCHMGVLRVAGPAAAAALARLLPRPVIDQAPGTCRYNFLLTEQGGVIDDLLVYRLAADEFHLVVNAGTAAGDAAWLAAHLAGVAEFADLSAATGKLDLQGPRAFEVLADLGLPPGLVPPYYRCRSVEFLGHRILLSRTGYTGERGVELYMPRSATVEFWERLTAHPLVKPAGLGARDTLRLEMGYPLYGHELTRETTPVEAGFGTFVTPTGREFPGADALRHAPRQRLVGLRLDGRRAARAGMRILPGPGGDAVGRVTSGAFAPSLGCAVALGYVRGSEPPAPGTPFLLGESTESAIPARVVPLPFHANGSARR